MVNSHREAISPEQMAVYRATARKRMAKRNAELDARSTLVRSVNGKYAALANRIEQKLNDIERVVGRAERLLNQAQVSDDDGYLDGVALNLHGYYAGVESIFEDIARNVDGSIPQGPDWRRALLLQMSGKTHGVRPKVIRYETRVCLDEYRRFRHIVRNVYTFNLRPSRLEELTQELRACFDALYEDLALFITFLNELAHTDN